MPDPMPHLPSVLVRVVKTIHLGDHVILLRDPHTFVTLEMQCQCEQSVCQYRALCCCRDLDCPWPEELHDPTFMPHFQQRFKMVEDQSQ